MAQSFVSKSEDVLLFGALCIAGFFVYKGYTTAKRAGNALAGAAGSVINAAQQAAGVLAGPFGKDADTKANIAAMNGDLLNASIYMPAPDFIKYLGSDQLTYANAAQEYWKKNPNGNFYDN